MVSAVSRDQFWNRRSKSRVMENQASVLLEEEENCGWTVVSTVKDGELEVEGMKSDEPKINTRKKTANTQKTFEDNEQKNKAEQPETGGGTKVAERGLQTTKRQGNVSEKEETEAAFKAGELGEEEDDKQEEEAETGGTLKVEQEGEGEQEKRENVDREQGKVSQQRVLVVEEAFFTDVSRILTRKEEQLRDLKPSPARKTTVQHQEQQPQAGRLWRISLIATLGILGWALLCGGGFKHHSCSIKEGEPVLSSPLKK